MEHISIFTHSHEGTDDAQIEKKHEPIIPRVSGYVSKVFIKTTILKKGYFIYDRQERLPIKIDEATANPLQQKAI
jgi:membrane fusion protein (multidrug efflux system)